MEEDDDGHVDYTTKPENTQIYKDISNLSKRVIKQNSRYGLSRSLLFRKIKKLQRFYDKSGIKKNLLKQIEN